MVLWLVFNSLNLNLRDSLMNCLQMSFFVGGFKLYWDTKSFKSTAETY